MYLVDGLHGTGLVRAGGISGCTGHDPSCGPRKRAAPPGLAGCASPASDFESKSVLGFQYGTKLRFAYAVEPQLTTFGKVWEQF